MIQIKNSKIVFALMVLWILMLVVNFYFKDKIIYEISVIINILGIGALTLLIVPRLGIYEYKRKIHEGK